MDNVTTLSEFQQEAVVDEIQGNRMTPLVNAANELLCDLALSPPKDEIKHHIGSILVSLAYFAVESGYDIGDVSATYGALIGGPSLSTDEWTAANMGRLLWYAGEAGDDEFNEKSALAGVIAGLAEMCHNAGMDLESAANEVLDG